MASHPRDASLRGTGRMEWDIPATPWISSRRVGGSKPGGQRRKMLGGGLIQTHEPKPETAGAPQSTLFLCGFAPRPAPLASPRWPSSDSAAYTGQPAPVR